MTPILLQGPAIEPVSLTEARNWLRITATIEDELIQALVTSARLVIEAQTQLLLIEQSWRLLLDAWPKESVLALPLRPVLSIDAIRIHDAIGGISLVPPESVTLYGDPMAPRVSFAVRPPAPGRYPSGIEVDLRAGFGAAASTVPEPLKLSILILTARWFENRGDAADDSTHLPAEVSKLIAPWRKWRLV
ncbi:MAG: hypothetical protein AB7F96_02770 [Beijerinckiaceae bacterium]